MSNEKSEQKPPATNLLKLPKKPISAPKMPKLNNKGFGNATVVRRSGRGR